LAADVAAPEDGNGLQRRELSFPSRRSHGRVEARMNARCGPRGGHRAFGGRFHPDGGDQTGRLSRYSVIGSKLAVARPGALRSIHSAAQCCWESDEGPSTYWGLGWRPSAPIDSQAGGNGAAAPLPRGFSLKACVAVGTQRRE
jgi:hypothetical protein